MTTHSRVRFPPWLMRSWRAASVAAALIAISMYFVGRMQRPEPQSRPSTSGFALEAYPGPYGEPLYLASQAISLSLNAYPAGHNPHDAIAGLLTAEDLDLVWLEFPAVESSTEDGYWVVGVRGTDLTYDVIHPPPAIGQLQNPPTGIQSPAAEGMFFVWSANTGQEYITGVLDFETVPNAEYTYNRLEDVIEQYGLPTLDD